MHVFYISHAFLQLTKKGDAPTQLAPLVAPPSMLPRPTQKPQVQTNHSINTEKTNVPSMLHPGNGKVNNSGQGYTAWPCCCRTKAVRSMMTILSVLVLQQAQPSRSLSI